MYSAKSVVENFVRELCQRARYRIRGEKPIAVVAILKYLIDQKIVGKCFLEIFLKPEHIQKIKAGFLDLAYGYSNLKDPIASWNNIAGENGELQEIVRGSKDQVDKAFSELTGEDIQSLYREYMTTLEKSIARELKIPVAAPKLEPHEIIEASNYGQFYLLIRNFERDVRNFIVDVLSKKFGKGWNKMLENTIPNMVQRWKDRKNLDEKWGIETEKNLIDYADITDYMQIIEKYPGIFSESPIDLDNVKVNFQIFAIRGRNPIMHCRNLTQIGCFSAQGAEQFLRKWMERMKKIHPK
jgi:hypothetical protein